METAMINGTELAYEVTGAGEPVLLIGTGPIADSFQPFRSERALGQDYRLIQYRQRPRADRRIGAEYVSFAEHAADAAALLAYIGVARAHIVGHSTGADIALQLAADNPAVTHTLALLEPPLMGVASAGAFLQSAGPAVTAYASGDRENAMKQFLTLISGLDWNSFRARVDKHVTDGVERAIRDADNFFESYLPALSEWRLGPSDAASISIPVLSVLGAKTGKLFVEGHELLRSWFPQVEESTIEGAGHLLHMEQPEPVARAVAGFFARHPLTEGVAGASARRSR